MRDIPVLTEDDNIYKATSELSKSLQKDMNIIKVKPPIDGDGMDAARKFLESVHILDFEKSSFSRKKKNKSPIAGFELWYNNNNISFNFYTEDDSFEKEYRQQLTGYYDGIGIESRQYPDDEFFIQVNKDSEHHEAIAVSDIYLNKHYFIPIASPQSDIKEISEDPYKRIINEIDTRDDTRVLLQLLYKPAPYSWTNLQNKTIETEAKKIGQMGGYQTKWFGLKIEEVDNQKMYEKVENQMLDHINEIAFYTNIRMAVIASGKTKEKAKQKARSKFDIIMNTLEHIYKIKMGQKFVLRNYRYNKKREAKKTLVDMVERNTHSMGSEGRLSQILQNYISRSSKHIILTADELSGLVHLPQPGDVSGPAVSWNETIADGQAPPGIDELDEDRVEELQEKLDEEEYETLKEIEDNLYRNENENENDLI